MVWHRGQVNEDSPLAQITHVPRNNHQNIKQPANHTINYRNHAQRHRENIAAAARRGQSGKGREGLRSGG